MSKKTRRKHRHSHDTNIHHLLWPRLSHNQGCSQLLRREFAFEIPVDAHRELHMKTRPVPTLDHADATWLWEEFKEVDHEMSLFEALNWLILHSPNDEFELAIIEQQGFLQDKLGRS